MLSKTLAALPLLAALMDQTMAMNSGADVKARADEHVVIMTIVETKYVIAGAQQTPAPAPPAPPAPVQAPTTLKKVVKPAQNAAPAEDAPQVQAASAPQVQAAAAGPSFSFSKRGLAYNDVNLANTFKKNCDACGWGYNWDSTPGNLASSVSFVPTLWSDRSDHTQNWDKNANAAISKGSKLVFSFNEPDNAGQAAMTPGYAADKHIQYMNKFSGKALVGAPAITNSGQPREGIAWLKEWISECSKKPNGGCKYDFCNVHWYSEFRFAETLFDHLSKAHAACGNKPIMLTEFAPVDGNADDISKFLKNVVPRLEKLDYLKGYAYFMVKQGILMNGNQPSAYGKTYATLPK